MYIYNLVIYMIMIMIHTYNIYVYIYIYIIYNPHVYPMLHTCVVTCRVSPSGVLCTKLPYIYMYPHIFEVIYKYIIQFVVI